MLHMHYEPDISMLPDKAKDYEALGWTQLTDIAATFLVKNKRKRFPSRGYTMTFMMLLFISLWPVIIGALNNPIALMASLLGGMGLLVMFYDLIIGYEVQRRVIEAYLERIMKGDFKTIVGDADEPNDIDLVKAKAESMAARTHV